MIEWVLFDLDGTIVNTNELIIHSFQHVLKEHGLPLLTREEIIPHMGTTLEYQLQTFAANQDTKLMEQTYRAFNYAHHDELIRSFPRVNETLEALKQRGIRMGIVTTKIRPTTIRALEMFDLLQYMETLVTVNDVQNPKPHPEPIEKALADLGADRERTLMVGDSVVDIQSAQAAGVKVAAVAWSLKGEATLRKYDPDYILHDMEDLLQIVDEGRMQS